MFAGRSLFNPNFNITLNYPRQGKIDSTSVNAKFLVIPEFYLKKKLFRNEVIN
jgi:hypothetical protein